DSVCHTFQIDQVQRRDIVRSDVVALRATAQGHRRKKVRGISHCAKGRWSIDADAEGRLAETKFPDDLFITAMKTQSMSKTSEFENLDATLTTLTPVANGKESQQRRKLFHRDGMIQPDSFGMSHDGPCSFRHGNPSHLCNLVCRLSDNLRIQSSPGSLYYFFQQ